MDVQDGEHESTSARYFALAAVWLRLAMTDIGLRFFPALHGKRFLHQPSDEQNMVGYTMVPPEIQRIASSVRRAAAHPLWFNMGCLRRSLVLQRLLEKRGIQSSIMFGVKRGHAAHAAVSHAITAHAWLMVVSPAQYSGLQIDLSQVKDTFTRLDRCG